MIGRYAIIRTREAGVHAGYVVAKLGDEVTLRDSRRIWQWQGAKTLSELAVYGPAKPKECKFAVPLERIDIIGACEIILCTKRAEDVIRAVPEWT